MRRAQHQLPWNVDGRREECGQTAQGEELWNSECGSRATGPRTPEGKARSSRNSLKHGGRAKATLILQGERQEDYHRLAEMWREEFQPNTPVSHHMVDKLILNEWLRARAERNLLLAEEAAHATGEDPMQWPEEVVRRLHLMQRYKTTAERAARHAYATIRQFVNDNLRAIWDYEKNRRRVEERLLRKELERRAHERVFEPRKEALKDEADPEVGLRLEDPEPDAPDTAIESEERGNDCRGDSPSDEQSPLGRKPGGSPGQEESGRGERKPRDED